MSFSEKQGNVAHTQELVTYNIFSQIIAAVFTKETVRVDKIGHRCHKLIIDARKMYIPLLQLPDKSAQ